MNAWVFREYDIRGLAEKDFDEEFALLLGKVHGTAIANRGGTRVAVGRDCRATSDAYAEAVMTGLRSLIPAISTAMFGFCAITGPPT